MQRRLRMPPPPCNRHHERRVLREIAAIVLRQRRRRPRRMDVQRHAERLGARKHGPEKPVVVEAAREMVLDQRAHEAVRLHAAAELVGGRVGLRHRQHRPAGETCRVGLDGGGERVVGGAADGGGEVAGAVGDDLEGDGAGVHVGEAAVGEVEELGDGGGGEAGVWVGA